MWRKRNNSPTTKAPNRCSLKHLRPSPYNIMHDNKIQYIQWQFTNSNLVYLVIVVELGRSFITIAAVYNNGRCSWISGGATVNHTILTSPTNPFETKKIQLTRAFGFFVLGKIDKERPRRIFFNNFASLATVRSSIGGENARTRRTRLERMAVVQGERWSETEIDATNVESVVVVVVGRTDRQPPQRRATGNAPSPMDESIGETANAKSVGDLINNKRIREKMILVRVCVRGSNQKWRQAVWHTTDTRNIPAASARTLPIVLSYYPVEQSRVGVVENIGSVAGVAFRTMSARRPARHDDGTCPVDSAARYYGKRFAITSARRRVVFRWPQL